MVWGVGLRPQHYAAWRDLAVPACLEVMSDNLLGHRGGPGLWHTERLAELTPLVLLHGVGLNIGSQDPVDEAYLGQLRALAGRLAPGVVSDHLSFSRSGGVSSYELLPLARTSASLSRLAARIDHVQELLGRQLSLENVSAYVSHSSDAWSEGAFFAELVRRTGCGVLLDVNNLYINACNFHRDAAEELAAFPLAAVTQIHVAGHLDCGSYLFDTHEGPVAAAVTQLLRLVLKDLPEATPVVLECDDPAASAPDLVAELTRVRLLATADGDGAQG